MLLGGGSDLLVVNATYNSNDGTFTIDKTYSEVISVFQTRPVMYTVRGIGQPGSVLFSPASIYSNDGIICWFTDSIGGYPQPYIHNADGFSYFEIPDIELP